MDLEVVGRHAMLFDDDAMAAFVNTRDALVDWNSLSIDRYDVRHLLLNPPPPLKRRHNLTRSSSPPFLPDGSPEQDLDHERYLDLPPTSDEQVQDLNKDADMMDTTGYHSVAFSYGNPDDSTEQKANDAESIFHPPFPVPESLMQNLPPTEKVHQIIARTALFVSKQGGQSEIILRVKQGDNPTFGFLMPDHRLHAYFRFLVDHQELLKSDEGKSLEEEKKTDTGLSQRGGALSLLGSVYGSGEDEDGTTDGEPEVKYAKPVETVDAVSANVSHGSEQKESTGNVVATDDVVSRNILPLKEKNHVIKRNRSINMVKGGSTTVIKKEGDVTANKSQASAVLPSTSKIELPIVEPPSDLKRVVEKIVEFILKNGREFEAVLAEQDRKFGRFPFLLPSNQYHPYYLKVLKETQEAKLLGKGHISEKRDSMGHGIDKKTALSKEGDTFSSRSADPDVLYEYDRKEKFKMVIGKSKKDGQDPPVKANQPQVGVSADAAAAILKAATRGIKNPSIGIFPKPSSSGIGQGPSDEGEYSSSFGSLHTSQHQSSIKMVDANGEPSVSVPMAKAIAETAALAAASEADSSEASLTREQKLKAERLKRAKMFAAMLKGGAAPENTETLRGLSVEPPGSGVSSGTEGINLLSKEREGSSVPFDANTLDRNETSEIKISNDECNERRSKRSYRSRSKRHEGEEEEDDDELGKEEEYKHRRDHKHSRKKHRSHRSSHHSKDRHKHRKRHSSSKDRESQQHNEHDSYSGYEHQQSPHQSKYNNSDDEHWPSKRRKHRSPSDSEHHHSRHQHKHVSSSDDEHRHSRRRHRYGGSSEDEHSHTRCRHKHPSPSGGENRARNRSSRHSKSHSKREVELEEGEICAKSDQSKASESERASREASVDLSKSYQHGRAPSQPSESTEVSDDLRAKIRAMLMATL